MKEWKKAYDRSGKLAKSKSGCRGGHCPPWANTI
jgi:hypothetical protein